MKKVYFLLLTLMAFLLMSNTGCNTSTSDQKLAAKQEILMLEAEQQVSMPNIINFTQRKTLKWIQELCDQGNLVNYAYTYSEMTGKYTYIGKCLGYALPFSTQFTNPEKIVRKEASIYFNMPQADPNGLFMPSSSEASWVVLIDDLSGKPYPIYSEPRLLITPFPISDDIVINPNSNPDNPANKKSK